MSGNTKESKIIQQDGIVFYVRATGEAIPLIKLASKCGYRIDNLCSELEVSPRHFRRLFDTSLGICPKKWLKAERMVFARNLLRGGLSIKEVSERLGFCAQKEFYREFRECYQIPPTEFRAQQTGRVMEKLGWAV